MKTKEIKFRLLSSIFIIAVLLQIPLVSFTQNPGVPKAVADNVVASQKDGNSKTNHNFYKANLTAAQKKEIKEERKSGKRTKSDNDYASLTLLQKNIVRLTVNMLKDSSFFFDKLWYDKRSGLIPYEDMEYITFIFEKKHMDLYFLDNQLVGANIFYDDKKEYKAIAEFISKNLYQVYDEKYEYRWIFANFSAGYLISTTLDKKNKRLNIVAV